MADTQLALEAHDSILTRQFDAPRALVWRAWTDPQMLNAWWGPETLTTTAVLDFRPAGELAMTMHAPDGTDYPITGEFGDIVENELLVMIMRVERHPPEWHETIRNAYVALGGIPEAYVGGPIPTRVTFEDDGQGTKVTVRQTFPLALVRDAHIKLGNYEGWSGSFRKLDTVLAASQA